MKSPWVFFRQTKINKQANHEYKLRHSALTSLGTSDTREDTEHERAKAHHRYPQLSTSIESPAKSRKSDAKEVRSLILNQRLWSNYPRGMTTMSKLPESSLLIVIFRNWRVRALNTVIVKALSIRKEAALAKDSSWGWVDELTSTILKELPPGRGCWKLVIMSYGLDERRIKKTKTKIPWRNCRKEKKGEEVWGQKILELSFRQFCESLRESHGVDHAIELVSVKS